jgi:ABC-type lipoprotein release transport system permease subunit
LGRGFRLGALGLVLGSAGATALGPLLSRFLFDVSPRDPISLGVVVAVLAGCILLASWIPARQAARIEPAEALRAG